MATRSAIKPINLLSASPKTRDCFFQQFYRHILCRPYIRQAKKIVDIVN